MNTSKAIPMEGIKSPCSALKWRLSSYAANRYKGTTTQKICVRSRAGDANTRTIPTNIHMNKKYPGPVFFENTSYPAPNPKDQAKREVDQGPKREKRESKESLLFPKSEVVW